MFGFQSCISSYFHFVRHTPTFESHYLRWVYLWFGFQTRINSQVFSGFQNMDGSQSSSGFRVNNCSYSYFGFHMNWESYVCIGLHTNSNSHCHSGFQTLISSQLYFVTQLHIWQYFTIGFQSGFDSYMRHGFQQSINSHIPFGFQRKNNLVRNIVLGFIYVTNSNSRLGFKKTDRFTFIVWISERWISSQYLYGLHNTNDSHSFFEFEIMIWFSHYPSGLQY